MRIYKELAFVYIVEGKKFLSKKEAEEYTKKRGKNVAKRKS
tara:strand:+ start:189 stop:311 length:123 start_codon:yes stop_codon:yes gene_type:complete